MTNGQWKPAKNKFGVAISSFKSDVPHSLQLNIGELVQVLEEFNTAKGTVTWLRGCTFNNKSKKGIFPASYIATKPCTVENEGQFETVTPVEDPIIKELSFVLREWNKRWQGLFVVMKSQKAQGMLGDSLLRIPSLEMPKVKKDQNLFETVRLVLEQLVKFRSLLVSDTLTKEKSLELKHQVVTIIDWGNGKLGLDLVPRVDYQEADPESVSIVEMYRIHKRSMENCKGAVPGGMVAVRSREYQGEVIHHLLVGLCSFACSIGESSEVYISLYENSREGKEGRFLSERFVIHFDKDGNRQYQDRNSSALFTDLSSDDILKDIYLIVQIFKKGRLAEGNSMKKHKAYHYRRPWGVSVLSLKDLFQIRPENELEYFLRVQCADNETQFSTFHEQLIKKQTHMTSRMMGSDKQNQGITLSVKVLTGDMKSVKLENPMLFSRDIKYTQRMGFSDFVNPGEVRNDLYLTLSGCELERGNKTACKNVEVRVTMFNEHYSVIPNCIVGANGEPPASDFYTYIVYHSNSPKWNETVKLEIPIELFNTAHIRLEFSHCSSKTEKKLIGFAFLTLTTKGNVTRQDSKYDLCLYKCDDTRKIHNYLRLPSLHDDFNDPLLIPSLPGNLPYHRSNKEYATVETFLCSSKFAQKSELMNVLQWSSSRVENIPKSLDSLLTLKGNEIVRYLQDVLDALFDMLNSDQTNTSPYSLNIFQALVHILNLLQEDTYEKFSIVLEAYLEKSFSYPVAHKTLLNCLIKQVEMIYTCTDFDEKVSAKKVFQVLEDIFKFVVKSCMLQQRINGRDAVVVEFRRNLNNVFAAFGKVLQPEEKELRKAQVSLLNNLPKIFTPLHLIMPPSDMAQLTKFVLGKIHKEATGSVLKAKTQLIQDTIKSQLLLDPNSRRQLLPIIIAHLKKCLIFKHHLILTANTLGDLLSTTFDLKQSTNVGEEVTKIIQGIFDVTVRALWSLTGVQREEAGGLLIACMTEMLRLMDVTHYQKLMNDYAKPEPLKVRLSVVAKPQNSNASTKEFLNRVLIVFRDLVNAEDYPKDWTTMTMITNNVMLTSIQYIADDLTLNFLSGSTFDRELWFNFFHLAVDFITQPALQLEKYSRAKSSQIKDRYDDMRVPVGFQIHSLWNQLGSNKQHLILDLVGAFLEVTMVPQLELRKATIPIFGDIMETEIEIHKSLKRVEEKVLQELDFLVIDHKGDKEYKELFSSILLDKAQSEPQLQEEGKRFVCSVTDLLDKLLDYREIMDREEQRDTKMHCTFNILNFYKDSREDMYIRYISRLYELHYQASNFVEAGLTLKLYAQLLTWSSNMLPAEMNYSAQTESQRKEKLLTDIINCFDKGKAWEYGIPVCKELAEQYEKTFQYHKLGQILQRQAGFFYSILEGHKFRQQPSYYRVAYYGNTFPPYLKNKAFIYRGDECLKLADIMSQLMTEYPSATILTTNSPPDESCKQGDTQYIQIMNVKPVPSQRAEFEGKDVPEVIASFYEHNEISTFQFDRPYYRDGEKDKNNEFKTLCLERTILTSSYKLPGILRWYEVTDCKVLQLNPVQTALDTVESMNNELRRSADNALAHPEQHLRHLEMRLQGVISGAVNGGIPKYQEAFFSEEYRTKHPDEASHIEDLKASIHDQLQLLERGLNIHGKHVSTEMVPLHRNLADMFSKIKASMGVPTEPQFKYRAGSGFSLGSFSQRPSTPSSASFNSSGSNRSSVVSAQDENSGDLDDMIYLEPTEEGRLPVPQFLKDPTHHSAKPPYPEKRRCSSLRVTTPDGQSAVPTGSRPLSAVLTSSQFPLPPERPVDEPGQPIIIPKKTPGQKSFHLKEIDTSQQQQSVQTPPPIPNRVPRSSVHIDPLKRSVSINSEPEHASKPPPQPPRPGTAAHSPVSPISATTPPVPVRRNVYPQENCNLSHSTKNSSLQSVNESDTNSTDVNANTISAATPPHEPTITSAATPPRNMPPTRPREKLPPPVQTKPGTPVSAHPLPPLPPTLFPSPHPASSQTSPSTQQRHQPFSSSPHPPPPPPQASHSPHPPPPHAPHSNGAPPPLPKRKPSAS